MVHLEWCCFIEMGYICYCVEPTVCSVLPTRLAITLLGRLLCHALAFGVGVCVLRGFIVPILLLTVHGCDG